MMTSPVEMGDDAGVFPVVKRRNGKEKQASQMP